MPKEPRYEHVKERLMAMGQGTAKEVHAALQPTPYTEREVENELDRLVRDESGYFEKVESGYHWKKHYRYRTV